MSTDRGVVLNQGLFESGSQQGCRGRRVPCRSAMARKPGGLSGLATSPFLAAEGGKSQLLNSPVLNLCTVDKRQTAG